MKSIAVAFSGAAGSGKSTLSGRVANTLGWPLASFGNYIRAEAARRGMAGTRRDLQELGMELLADEPSFCRAVIAQSRWRPGQSLILDGLRHESVLKTLQQLLAPTEVIPVFLRAAPLVRENRLRERGEVHVEGVLEVDSHPVEGEVRTLLERYAIRVVDSSGNEEDKADELVEFFMELCGIPERMARFTGDYTVRIPRSARNEIGLRPGDSLIFSSIEGHLKMEKLAKSSILGDASLFGNRREHLVGEFVDSGVVLRKAIVIADAIEPDAPGSSAGNFRLTEALLAYQERVKELERVYSGKIIKFIGNGVLAVFEDVESGFGFASMLHQALNVNPIAVGKTSLRIRTVIHVGEVHVVQTPYGSDAVGSAVAYAARLLAFAQSESILVSNSAKMELPDEITGQLSAVERESVQSSGDTLEFCRYRCV